MVDIIERFNDDEVYYADREYLSNSSLKLLKESPTKFDLWRKNKWSQASTSAFDVGRALHARFLEDKVNYTDWNGARRGAEYKNFCAENPDTIVLTKNDYHIVEGMYDKLSKVPQVEDIMGLSMKPEVPGVLEWETEKGNIIKLKGKADALAWDGELSYLVDLKTTKDPLHKWKRNAFYNYAQQAYLYSEIFDVNVFYFLVVQKEFPYEVGIYKAGDAFLARGEKELEESINLYERLFIDGEYKPYSADIDVI
jgi:hypothetical protein